MEAYVHRVNCQEGQWYEEAQSSDLLHFKCSQLAFMFQLLHLVLEAVPAALLLIL